MAISVLVTVWAKSYRQDTLYARGNAHQCAAAGGVTRERLETLFSPEDEVERKRLVGCY
jgi:hypothetical protein